MQQEQTKTRTLEKGDIVYKVSTNGTIHRYEITRVSPKFAYAEGQNKSMRTFYREETKFGTIKLYGNKDFVSGHYKIASDELNDKWERKELEAKLIHITGKQAQNLPIDKLRRIVAIIEE